jgi:hypothetical protein
MNPRCAIIDQKVFPIIDRRQIENTRNSFNHDHARFIVIMDHSSQLKVSEFQGHILLKLPTTFYPTPMSPYLPKITGKSLSPTITRITAALSLSRHQRRNLDQTSPSFEERSRRIAILCSHAKRRKGRGGA